MEKSSTERVTLIIDNELIDWIEQQVKDRQFANRSDGIRKCIEIAKRVYENANPEDVMKYINAINTKKS